MEFMDKSGKKIVFGLECIFNISWFHEPSQLIIKEATRFILYNSNVTENFRLQSYSVKRAKHIVSCMVTNRVHIFSENEM